MATTASRTASTMLVSSRVTIGIPPPEAWSAHRLCASRCARSRRSRTFVSRVALTATPCAPLELHVLRVLPDALGVSGFGVPPDLVADREAGRHSRFLHSMLVLVRLPAHSFCTAVEDAVHDRSDNHVQGVRADGRNTPEIGHPRWWAGIRLCSCSPRGVWCCRPLPWLPARGSDRGFGSQDCGRLDPHRSPPHHHSHTARSRQELKLLSTFPAPPGREAMPDGTLTPTVSARSRRPHGRPFSDTTCANDLRDRSRRVRRCAPPVEPGPPGTARTPTQDRP